VAAEAARGGLWVAMRRVKLVRVLARRTGCSLEAERMKEDIVAAAYTMSVVWWCRRRVFVASSATSMAKTAGLSWRYDARLTISDWRIAR
jgi:hypothetical protein